MNVSNFVIILYGPTGVGKTACADYLASILPVELINADMGQLYAPLTIGTAKPDWRASCTAHHLFDVLDKPERFSVKLYRERVKRILSCIWEKKKIPLIVGGSSYYIAVLFFPPASIPSTWQTFPVLSMGMPDTMPDNSTSEQEEYLSNEVLWEKLHEIDPVRAAQINPSDRYRVERALAIWQHAGTKPSEYAPIYEPIADYYVIWCTRERDELYRRINERVVAMMGAGWIAEVKGLQGTNWEQFLRQKKIIGYIEIFDYLEGKIPYDTMIRVIQKQTRNYAKRQITFWRMLKKKLEIALKLGEKAHRLRCKIETVNLTKSTIERYSERLKETVKKLLL